MHSKSWNLSISTSQKGGRKTGTGVEGGSRTSDRSMAMPWGTRPPTNKPPASSEGMIHGLSPLAKLVQVKEVRRRSLLPLLVSTATLPQGNDSKKALLQEYQKRSKENKARNDKERLDDYYKRNYKDYFELIDGSGRGKKEELLSESERGIRAWLEKNKK